MGWGGGETPVRQPHEFTTNEILRAIGSEVKTIKSIASFFMALAVIQILLVFVLFLTGAFG